MRGHLRVSSLVFITTCLVLISAMSTRAQCPLNRPFYGDFGVVPNNPFQAEKVITSNARTPPDTPEQEARVESIARDGQGRVRIERVTGEYEIQTGSEAGSRVRQHIVSICDPVANTITQIDTLNKSAKILRPRELPVTNTNRREKSVCAYTLRTINTPNMQTEDLGHRIIDGVDAAGIRRTRQPGEISPSRQKIGPTIDEIWCSDELGAVVLTTHENSNGHLKSEVTLSNLQRQEPDPALFRIPADYTVSESIPDPKPGHLVPVPSNGP